MLPALAAKAAAQLDVFTRRQALAAGYTADEIRARLDGDDWRTVRRGAYTAKPLTADPGRTHIELCAAVTLQRPSLVLSHRSAAALHGLTLIGPLLDVTATSTSGNGAKRNGVHVRRAAVRRGDAGRLAHMRMTAVARTVVDVASTEPFGASVVVADSALRCGNVTRTALVEALERADRDSALARINRVITFADAGSESAGESLTRVLMADGVLPAPLVNCWIGEYRVDLLLEKARVIVEFDGRVKYTDPDVLWKEKLRQEWLAQQGYEIVRVTWHEVVNRPQETLARIHAAVARSMRRAGR